MRRRRFPCRWFEGDGVDGTEDPREVETDVDTYDAMPPLDSAAANHYSRKGRE